MSSRGRASNHSADRRMKTVQFRVTEAAYERLQAAADETGRCLSHELEMRVEQSLSTDALRMIVRDEFARYRAENETRLPNMRAEDLEEWMRH